MKKERILFRTAGGRAQKKELGFGHINRCINLAKELKNSEIYFLIEDYGGVQKTLQRKGFKNIFLLKNGISINSDIKETKNFILKKEIDLLIVDKYRTKVKFLKEIKKFTKLVFVTDLRNIEYPAHLLVNGFIGFDNSVIKNKFGTKCLLGPKYQILNSDFAKYKTVQKKYDLLATFGGFDENKLFKILLMLLGKYVNLLRIKIILGPFTVRTKVLKKYITKYNNKNLEIIQQTDKMQSLIAKARFGICSGGITTYEFAAMKVPFAIICQVRHQLITAKEWERQKVALNFGLINNKTRNKIRTVLDMIVEKKHIQGLRKSNYIDGFGAKRVAREIIQLS